MRIPPPALCAIATDAAQKTSTPAMSRSAIDPLILNSRESFMRFWATKVEAKGGV
jgi:hypothetical protein